MEKSYKIPNKIEKHLRKNKKAWSRKGLVAILTYTIVVILTSLFVKSMWDGYWRGHSWKFQTPVIFQSPLIIKEVKAEMLLPVISAKNAPEGKIEPDLEYSEEFERAYHTVRVHESSDGKSKSGLNGVCIAQGMINEIGFAPHEAYCFTDEKDQKATFMLWLKNRYGIPCVKQGFCRASIGDLLSLYSSGAYKELL